MVLIWTRLHGPGSIFDWCWIGVAGVPHSRSGDAVVLLGCCCGLRVVVIRCGSDVVSTKCQLSSMLEEEWSIWTTDSGRGFCLYDMARLIERLGPQASSCIHFTIAVAFMSPHEHTGDRLPHWHGQLQANQATLRAHLWQTDSTRQGGRMSLQSG